MPATRRLAFVAVVATLAVAACSRGFQLKKYPTNNALYKASFAEFQKKKWDNAITGFEKLTTDLSARDTLLPLAHYYLGKAHEGKGEYLLAAQSYARLAESFPDDSLAAAALLAAGDSYLKMWRDPSLDPTYATMAQTQYRLLVSVYPDSPLKDKAVAGAAKVDEMLATKDYETGMHYVRRRAFDSALIYLKDVVRNYPSTQRSRDAMLRIVEVYRRPEMNYKDEAKEMCVALNGAYPGDADVAKLCPAEVAADTSKAKPKLPVPTLPGVRKPAAPPR
ncbi:MAG: outer membrane protein assembly factor BamD [Gemmatimonadetes bacterium]|nr:outer membrane protein assembly factor BamD [Gemmatimonadota bacterium]MBI3566635.1 outer membrane protein assembly factor BamD [Gemmatimonadota bacterium]